ncbi:xanthine dehydrogenase family protein molybdopterin-binding subunit [Shinella sp. CPCC 100929]|uniref:Xanthine dehydrogenase family protein molybdopterin-binding subunit n=1 Tax=Shinella lacus TaxID=2654216 RepID=A0ABT1REB6_9HYPH|nr:xanthine dehydrogenase family protein molybdopterin-binding subunit [Shinella lacus]MCQ4633534.1 xanthine dehydrogenase family protein molybdopterin-binding subunit [Shinella lacus]
MQMRSFGQSIKRKEDPAFLTGKGRYVDDIELPNMAHAAFVRSPLAHAKIKSIDASAARAMDGVIAVITYHELPETLRQRRLPLVVPVESLTNPRLPYTLARDEVCYVGEAIAIVVAENRYIAEDAVAQVMVDLEPLGVVADCRAGLLEGAPRSHLGADSNIAATMPSVTGDIDAAFSNARHVFKESIFQHRGGAFFMECRGAIAHYDQFSENLLVYVSSQGVHRIKRSFHELFDIQDSKLRIVTPDVGGGFGPKGSYYVEYGAVAAASMATGRPVKWIEDRRENFVATHQERDQYWDVEIAVDENAKILGVRGTLTHDNGAYTPWGIVLPWISVATVPGPYVIPAYDMTLISVITNKVPTTPVRGAGRPQAVFVMERLLERVAKELGLDPAEVRRRNFIKPEQMPYDVGVIFRDGRPVVYDSGDYPKCQEVALEAINYEAFAERQKAALSEGRYIGIGIGNAVEATGLGPYEGVTVRIGTNGNITAYTGATPQGQAHKTTLAQIVADHFGVSIDAVTVETGDTSNISFGIGTFASRTAVNAGSSAHLAGQAVATKVREIAAQLLEVEPDDIELTDGVARVKGPSNRFKTLRELAVYSLGKPGFSLAPGMTPGLENTAYFTPTQSSYANGTSVAEVEVDVETGRVHINRLVMSHDCGRVINPMVVDGQVVGGVAHGVGNALFERMVHDDQAQPLSTNFGEYMLPLAADVPRVEIHHQETASPNNPLGVKGAGEGGTIPTIVAIVNAVANALAPLGVHIAEAPLSPQRIIQLIDEAKARSVA